MEPQPPHFLAAHEQHLQWAFVDHRAVLQHKDAVGALEGRSPMRSGENGRRWIGAEPRPECRFGRSIERRQIVEHQELRLAHEHAGGGGALELAAGQCNTTGSNLALETIAQTTKIGFELRDPERLLQGLQRFSRLEVQQQVIAECLTEQTR